MSKYREEFEQLRRLLKRLCRPNARIPSWNSLAIAEGLGNDKVVRLLARAEELVCGKLAHAGANGIGPTTLAGPFSEWLEELHALQQSQLDGIPEIVVAIRPGVDPQILASALAACSRENGPFALRVTIQSEGMQEAVDAGLISLGVTWGDAKSGEKCEWLEPPIPISVRIPPRHPLYGTAGPLDPEHFAPTARVFVTEGLGGYLGDFLHRLAPVNQVEVASPELLRQLVDDGCGLGVEIAHPSSTLPGQSARVLAADINPLRLGLIGPRKRDVVEGPAIERLIDAIRTAVREAALPPIPSIEPLENETDLPPLPEPLPALISPPSIASGEPT